ncbi:MAG: bifunctional DNA-formamidopyrimidine glycosylase/DNA-(apurinic or apyrimidinic site) lyase [Candidatus Moranbacteria bacterium]|jgi:formamidopyrimidine-DNA glycosylase|nr:bifunctional DNA-formamidopyrimidine glycosylase/DNA-(apurinic or apyrimidinic site) lyase [Candidatus Moranbacteria bacterium]
MPELPEVETVVRDLNKKIKDYKIVDFWSEWKKALKGVTYAEFKKNIIDREISGVRRIGKNIFIDLSGGKTLYLHLKMTGHLLIKNEKLGIHPLPSPLPKGEGAEKKVDFFADRVNQYIRHKWTLKRGGETLMMDFSDLRKFGKIVLVDTDKVKELPEIKKLGIDAMDKKFDLKKFKEILAKKQKSIIGIALMDQYLIAGIGNIYRSEILFEAGVDPKRKVSSLKPREIERIFLQIKEILKKAIKMRGTSDSDYRDTSGKPGGFQKVLKVYQRAGKKCLGSQALLKNKKCDNIIERITLGQRSVFWCKKCQK